MTNTLCKYTSVHVGVSENGSESCKLKLKDAALCVRSIDIKILLESLLYYIEMHLFLINNLF
jgi:hypothetical protein